VRQIVVAVVIYPEPTLPETTLGPAEIAGDADDAVCDDDIDGHSWRRSSRCGTHGSCVEISDLDGGAVAVRDGKTPDTSPILVFDRETWLAFISGIQAGEFS
jgi:hypothetical protein